MAALPEIADVQILDLRHFSARELRPVLEEESRMWSTRLRWDYRSSAELLLQYLDSRVLPGYVALHQGRVCGYVFCVYEGSKAVIGDVFVSEKAGLAESPAAVEDMLLEHLLETLTNSPGTERIEAQLLPHSSGTHSEVFLRHGFRIFRRLFLELDLAQSGSTFKKPDGITIHTWTEDDFSPAGPLIAAAYAGHLDSLINDQYRSLAGSLRFLHNIVRFPGCGLFDAMASFVALKNDGAEPVGLVLCSRISEDVAHVTQLCVAQNARHYGVGSALLLASESNLRKRRFKALTLTVTEANENAVALYRRAGFKERHSFDAMMWERDEQSL
jgi:ribosomal protein S18 acetylase RimI-like enzyme